MESDKDLLKFVAFLDKQIDEHPELVIPADEEQIKRIQKLIKESL